VSGGAGIYVKLGHPPLQQKVCTNRETHSKEAGCVLVTHICIVKGIRRKKKMETGGFSQNRSETARKLKA